MGLNELWTQPERVMHEGVRGVGAVQTLFMFVCLPVRPHADFHPWVIGITPLLPVICSLDHGLKRSFPILLTTKTSLSIPMKLKNFIILLKIHMQNLYIEFVLD